MENLDEYDKSAVMNFLDKSERLKPRMSLVDNILNYLTVYPAEFCSFYWLIFNHSARDKSKNCDVGSGIVSSLFESLDIPKHLTTLISGVIIGLAEIKNEIEIQIGEKLHDDSPDRSYWG